MAASSHTTASVCVPAAVAGFEAELHAKSATTTTSMGNNGMPQCQFKAGKVVALVNVDNGPEPFARLERTAEEASQPFSSQRLSAAPIDIKGLGLDADWFPQEQQLMTSDGVRLITITLTWPHAKQASKIAFSKRLARPYLGKPNAKGPLGEV